jgi:hypothetical protein
MHNSTVAKRTQCVVIAGHVYQAGSGRETAQNSPQTRRERKDPVNRMLCVLCDFAVNYFVCFTGPLGSNSESANPLL